MFPSQAALSARNVLQRTQYAWKGRPAALRLSAGFAGAFGATGLSFASCAEADAKLPPQALNQKPGRQQSLTAWSIIREDGDHYVQRVDDRNERYKAPDGSNFTEGIAHPPFIRQANWTHLRSRAVGARDGDVWVATFPKCGTTFTEQIVLLLLNDGDVSRIPGPKDNNAYDPTVGTGKVWVEASVRIVDDDTPKKTPMSLEEFDALPAPRVLKTHAPRSIFLGVCDTCPASVSSPGRPAPLAAGVKVIYVSRMARDACVSAYYHAANPHKLGIPFDAWVKIWMSGLFEHGRWSDHVLGWWAEALSNPEQVLWVRYEDLKADPRAEICRIARFLNLKVTDTAIDKTIEHSGFAAMRAQSGDRPFFRKGLVGDSRKHFSEQLSKEFDELYAEQMRGARDPYSDLLE